MCLFIFCIQTYSARAQTLIAGWDFEGTSLPEGSTGTSRGGFFASAGTQVGVAEASGVHTDRRTGWATPSGNGSGKSLSATSWNVGNYFQFRVSSLGFTGLTVGWDQIRDSGAGWSPVCAWRLRESDIPIQLLARLQRKNIRITNAVRSGQLAAQLDHRNRRDSFLRRLYGSYSSFAKLC